MHSSHHFTDNLERTVIPAPPLLSDEAPAAGSALVEPSASRSDGSQQPTGNPATAPQENCSKAQTPIFARLGSSGILRLTNSNMPINFSSRPESVRSDVVRDTIQGLEQLARSPSGQYFGSEASFKSGDFALNSPHLVERPREKLFHGAFFHGMISYRVRSEGDSGNGFAMQLYKEVLARSDRHPMDLSGMWPSFALKPENYKPGVAKIYLDVKCLKPGEPWECGNTGTGGFIGGVSMSMVFVPLLSWYPDGSGSLGQMATLKPPDQDYIDNVLLEMVIATYLLRTGKGAVRAIVPILLGEKDEHGRYQGFPFEKLGELSHLPSFRTNTRALELLDAIKAAPHPASAEEKEFMEQSVHSVIKQILTHQGVKLSAEGTQYKALEAAASSVLTTVETLVGGDTKNYVKSKLSYQAFKFHKPAGLEVVDWLRQNELLRYKDLFPREGLDSLRTVSCLSDQQVSQLQSKLVLDTGMDEYGIEGQGQEIQLRNAVHALRKDPRSRSFNDRLYYFIDRDANGMAAFMTRNGYETAVSSPLSRFFVVFSCFNDLILIGYHWLYSNRYLLQPMVHKEIDPQKRLWRAHPAFWLSLAIGGVVKCWAIFTDRTGSKFQRDLAKYSWFPLFFFGILQAILETVQCNVEGEGVGVFCSGLDYYFACCLVSVATWIICYIPKYYWFVQYLLYGNLGAGFAVGLVNPALDTDIRIAWGLIGFSQFCIAGAIIVTRWLVVQRAKKERSDLHRAYNNIWQKSLQTPASARDDVEYITQTLGRLKEQIESVQREIEPKRYGSEWWMIKLGFKRPMFAPSGKLNQNVNDFEKLMTLAESISHDFQDWVQGWAAGGVVIPGPVKSVNRCIQKCVRNYDRDPSCLTDLVRCTVLVKDMSEARKFVEGLMKRSVTLELLDAVSKASSWENTSSFASTFASFADAGSSRQDLMSSRTNSLNGKRVKRLTSWRSYASASEDIESGGGFVGLDSIVLSTSSDPNLSGSPVDDFRSSTSAFTAMDNIVALANPVHSVQSLPRSNVVLLTSRNSVPPPFDPDRNGNDVELDDQGGIVRPRIVTGADMEYLRVVHVKNLYDISYNSEESGGYRHICLNVEIGWTEHGLTRQFVPVDQWHSTPGCKTLICEIQVILESAYLLTSKIGHARYVQFRDTIGT